MNHHTQLPFLFFAFANSKNKPLPKLQEEQRDIDQLLEEASHLCNFKIQHDITGKELHSMIKRKGDMINIFHFGGHSDGYQTVFNNENNEDTIFGGEGLVGLLKDLPNLVLVFINGCKSKQMVNELHEAGIPVVIGTTDKVQDKHAYELSRAFYENLTAEHTIEKAWQMASNLSIGAYSNLPQYRAVYFSKKDQLLKEKPESAWFIKIRADKTGKDWKLKPIAPPRKAIHINAIPSRPLENIIGRRQILKDIHTAFQTHQSLLLVNGMGGIGKTTVAEVYISEYAQEYDYLIWLRVESDVQGAFLNDGLLLRNLSLEELIYQQKSLEDKVAAWQKIVIALNQREGKGLFVADNVDTIFTNDESYTYQALEKLRQTCPALQILITSREKRADIKTFPVEIMGEQDAVDLFYFYYEKEGKQVHKDDIVKEIVWYAGYHTLTIELLAKVLYQHDFLDAEKLLAQLKAKSIYLDQKMPVRTAYNPKQQHIDTVLEYCFDVSDIQKDSLTWDLLRTFSILPAFEVHSKHLVQMMGISPEKENEYLKALNYLVEKGWVRKESQAKGVYHCHAIVQTILRKKMEANAETCDGVIQFLIDKIKEIYYINPLQAVEWISYTDNILQKIADETQKMAALANNLQSVYQAIGDLPKLLKYGLKALTINEKMLLPEHPNLATSYNNIAEIYRIIGNLPKSLEYNLKTLIIREKILSPEHPDLATSYNNISITYQKMGDLSKSLKYSLKDLAICEKFFLSEHPYLAGSYNNIAVTYQLMGNLPKSLEYGLKALTIKEKILLPEHPDLATSYNNIAATYQQMGNLVKSLEYCLKALTIRKKIFLPEHLDLATSYNNVASLYQKMGDLSKSLKYCLKALTIREKMLSPEHPDLANSYNSIAVTYAYLSNWEQAILFEQKALQIYLKILRFEHYSTKNAVNTMSAILNKAIDEKGKEWAVPYIDWFLEHCKAYLEE